MTFPSSHFPHPFFFFVCLFVKFQVGQRRMDLMWLLVREEETVDAGDAVEVSIGE